MDGYLALVLGFRHEGYDVAVGFGSRHQERMLTSSPQEANDHQANIWYVLTQTLNSGLSTDCNSQSDPTSLAGLLNTRDLSGQWVCDIRRLM